MDEAAYKGDPTFDQVYADIHNITEKAVNRFAGAHVAEYESGKSTGLAEPSNNVSDGAISSAVQTHWTDITGIPAA